MNIGAGKPRRYRGTEDELRSPDKNSLQCPISLEYNLAKVILPSDLRVFADHRRAMALASRMLCWLLNRQMFDGAHNPRDSKAVTNTLFVVAR